MGTQPIDFLPALPFEGPPLPRFLGIRWPQGEPAQPEVASYDIKAAEIFFPGEEPPNQAPAPEPPDHNQALDPSKELIRWYRE